jgi:MFS family permease
MLEPHAWRNFIAVTLSIAVVGVGIGSTFPLVALMLTARGNGPDVVGWMAAASAVGGVIGVLSSPALTQRLGRRRFMLVCVALGAASVVALQYVDDLASWAALRLLFGISMSPLFVIGEAWINDLPADRVRGRVVAIYTTSFAFFHTVGPPLTSALSQVPTHAFLICGAIFLLGLPGLALARENQGANPGAGLPPGTAAVSERDATATWGAILRAAPAVMAGTAFFAAFDAVALSFLPLFAIDEGMTPSRALTAVTVVLVGDTLMQFAAGWFADRFGRARVQLLCGLALCALVPLLPRAIHYPGLWEAYLFVLGGFAGAIYTLSLVAIGEYFRGAALLRASSLVALTWSLSSIAAPAATGWIMQRRGPGSLMIVLWLMALGFIPAARAEARGTVRRRAARPATA